MDDREPSPVFLKGKKVNLRPLSRADIPLLTRWVNNPDVRDFISRDLPLTEIQEEDWLARQKDNRENIVLMIETKAGIPIGTMGMHLINWKDRITTTGAMIGEKEYQGKGYGTDAKMALLDYAFNTLNFHKICSSVISYNKRSLRYSLHCGYKIEGRGRRHIFKKGRYWDMIFLGLFKKEWLPYWKKYIAAE